MGHIDFPKRYYGEIYYEEPIINEIFRNLLEKDLVIEINTSSLRKGYVQTMPEKELLKEVGLQEVIYRQRERQII